jgi:dipeptidyl-peptidase-4
MICQRKNFLLKTEKGNVERAWIIKPKDFDASKKYPVLCTSIRGPGSQQVMELY